jgi:hypothetical protein
MLIERELRSSISYIKRLGYTDLDRLDLVVLGDAALCQVMAERDLPVASVTALIPRQAAEKLNLDPVGPEDSPYADLLHAQHLATRRRPKITLPTDRIRRRLKDIAAFKAGFVTAAGLTVFALLCAGWIGADLYDVQSTIGVLEAQMAVEQQGVDASGRRLQGFPVPIEDLLAVERSETALAKVQANPTAVLRTIAGVLGQSVRAQKVSFSTLGAAKGPAPAAARGPAAKAEALYEVRLTVRFYGDAAQAPDAVLTQAKDLRDRLAKALPGHEVDIERLPQGAAGGLVIEGTTGAKPGGPSVEPATADYVIRKGA